MTNIFIYPNTVNGYNFTDRVRLFFFWSNNLPTLPSLDNKMNIKTIVWPIFIESLVRMSLMTVDVFMLARFSADAVAAVGLTGHFLFFLIVMFMVVSSGSAILIGQNLGAKNYEDARAYSQSGFLLSIIVSGLVSLLFVFGTKSVVGIYSLEPAVALYAEQYLFIVGSLSVGLSVGILLSTVLRAHGYSKSPMVLQLVSGGINVVGNYLALFPPFGLPVTGVVGVAFATVFSQVIATLIGLWMIKRHKINFSIRKSFHWDSKRLVDILKLGIPNAGEALSYNIAQMTIMFFVAQFGTAALAGTAIAQTLSRFMFVFSMSLGGGSQILAAYLVGQNRQQELKRNVHKYWMVAVAVSFSFAAAMALFREQIGGLFSTDVSTQAIISVLLLMALLLEPGRAINLVVIQTLKGTGDVVFPVKMGVLSMWGIGVALAYLFGVHLAWGVVGIWLAVSLDEWTRGVTMIIRWQREKWMTMKKVGATA